MGGTFLVEVILTFVFVLAVLGVTASEKMGSVAGIAIGLTLAFVHIMGGTAHGHISQPGKKSCASRFYGRTGNRAGMAVYCSTARWRRAAALVWIFLIKDKKQQAA